MCELLTDTKHVIVKEIERSSQKLLLYLGKSDSKNCLFSTSYFHMYSIFEFLELLLNMSYLQNLYILESFIPNRQVNPLVPVKQARKGYIYLSKSPPERCMSKYVKFFSGHQTKKGQLNNSKKKHAEYNKTIFIKK